MDAAGLYALAPEDFTAARDEASKAARAARAAGDPVAATALKTLRRPSVAAWLVNRLTVEQPVLLDQLLGLGPALAEAQAGGDAAALRTLGAQRRALVGAVADAAAQGRTVSAAVRTEVVATLEAALADPGSAEAVRSGRLVRALSYAGFGPVDLAGAVAQAPEPSPARAGKAARAAVDASTAAAAAAVAVAERETHEAAGRLDDAVLACEQAERRRVDATGATDEAGRAVAHARSALTAAEQEQVTAAQAQQGAESDSAVAVQAVRLAQEAAEHARTTLDGLRRA